MKYKIPFVLILPMSFSCSYQLESLPARQAAILQEDKPPYKELHRTLALRGLPAGYAQQYDQTRFNLHDILLFVEKEIAPQQANRYSSCFYGWDIAELATPVMPKYKEVFGACVHLYRRPILDCMVPRVSAEEANKRCEQGWDV